MATSDWPTGGLTTPCNDTNAVWLVGPGSGGPAGVFYPAPRLFQFGTGGSLGDMVAPTAGGLVDGVSVHDDAHNFGSGPVPAGLHYYFACPGLPVPVEAGGSFSAGAFIRAVFLAAV